MDNRQHIGRIVAEALLQGKTVYLDDIGMLTPKRKPAVKEANNGAGVWHPPCVYIEFEPASVT